MNKTQKQVFYSFVFLTLPGCTSKIDLPYIEKKEWLNESGNIIRFDDKSQVLKHDTIFEDNQPKFIIKALDKTENEMTVFSLSKGLNITYTSTEEFIK
jgi:hypothetical protein